MGRRTGALLALLVGGCRTPLPEPEPGLASPPGPPPQWLTVNHDYQQRRRVPFAGPSRLDVGWTAEVPGRHVSFAIGGDGTVFLAGGETVLAFDSVARAVRWTRRFQDRSLTQVQLGDDGTVLYVTWSPMGALGMPAATLCALGPSDGTIRWQQDQSPIMSGHTGVMVSGDVIYEASWTTVTRRRASDGARLWTVDLPNAGWDMAAIGAGGEPLVGHRTGLALLEPEDGSVRWTIRSDRYRVIVGDDGTIYRFGSPEGTLIATDPITGADRFIRPSWQGLPVPAPDGTLRFVVDEALVASVTADNRELWRVKAPAGEQLRYGGIVDGDGALFAQSFMGDVSRHQRIAANGRVDGTWTSGGELMALMASGLGFRMESDRDRDRTTLFFIGSP